MKPPHAFIDQCKNGKNSFKGALKKTRPITTILTRQRQNIDMQLRQQQEFEEVREAFKRVRSIRRGGSNYPSNGCDSSPPKTLNMTKKLIENRRPNQHDMNEHANEL